MAGGTSCVSCGASRRSFVCERGPTLASPRPVILYRCSSCDLVYQRGWSESFDSDAYDYYVARKDWAVERVYKSVNARRIELLLASLGPKVRGRTLLDVGCGAGHMVNVAAASGWKALGIDLSQAAIEIGQRLNGACQRLDFFDEQLDAQRFDVILRSEFIEHVAAPARFLRRASDLLEEGGLVYVTTPNFRSASRYILGSEWEVISDQHLSYFTATTFRRLVEGHTSLAVESLETRNLSPFAISKVRSFLTPGARLKSRAPSPTRPESAADAGPDLRVRIERSRVLRAAKRAANLLLDVTSLGENLFAVLRRRPAKKP